MSLEQQIKWTEREDKGADPVEFCNKHYLGATPGELQKKDSALYQVLHKYHLWDKIKVRNLRDAVISLTHDPNATVETISQSVGIKKEVTCFLLRREPEVVLQWVERVFSQGWEQGNPVTFSYLTRTLGLEEPLVARLAENFIELEGESVKLKELLYDDVVIAGKTLVEIASAIGSTHRQRAEQYLCHTGQYEKWEAMKERRKEQEAEEQMKLTGLRKELLDVLVSKMVDDTKNDWPVQTALRIYRGRAHNRSDSHSLEQLEELFQWYEYAVEQDDPMRLEDFSAETKMPITSISQLLAQAGVRPLRRVRKKGYVKPRICLSSLEKRRIQKGRTKTYFSGADLGYFLRQPFWNIQQNSPGAEHRKPRPNYGILNFSYKTASEIYEARSTMSDEEIQQVLGIQDNCYKKYLQHQPEISRDIVKGLRAIYPEKAKYVQKPFVPLEIRHLQQQETFEQVVLEEVRTAIREGAKGNIELEEKTGHSIRTIQKYASRAGGS